MTKSSSSLRVAFLRQEFIDELVMERTLKDELLSVFSEEYDVLADISRCEEELSLTVDDADRMQDVLNRLQSLQDRAVALNVYNLDTKVLKSLTQMGFTSEDQSSKVSSFSGGWKMRIGLAKILCREPYVLRLLL